MSIVRPPAAAAVAAAAALASFLLVSSAAGGTGGHNYYSPFHSSTAFIATARTMSRRRSSSSLSSTPPKSRGEVPITEEPDFAESLQTQIDEKNRIERIRTRILKDVESGKREVPEGYGRNIYDPYGDGMVVLDGDEEGEEEEEGIDPRTLGRWDVEDLLDKFDYEFDLSKGDADPNVLDPNTEHVVQPPIDEDGVEVMYDPIFGRSNPIDERTIVTTPESYMVDEKSRNESMITPDFHPNDIEIEYNSEVKEFRKSLKIIETYTDPWLQMDVPKNVAKWHGYPEERYPDKPYLNNRFTKEEDLTPFDSYDAHRARKTAVQLARAKNNEWLPKGFSAEWHANKTAKFREYDLLLGTTQPAKTIDTKIVKKIQPALDILGSCAKLLSIEGIEQTVFRFHYFGLMKNKFGMQCWTETLIKDCGVDCTGVVFETGKRKRDPAYDGGDPWFGDY